MCLSSRLGFLNRRPISPQVLPVGISIVLYSKYPGALTFEKFCQVTQESLEAYARDNQVVVAFTTQTTTSATGASRDKIFLVSVECGGNGARVVAASRSEYVAKLKAAEEALSLLAFTWKGKDRLQSFGWKSTCNTSKRPPPALLLADMADEDTKRARLAKAKEHRAKMDASMLEYRCGPTSAALADDSTQQLGLQLKYRLGLKLNVQVKPQEYKTLSTARHGGGQADELKSFAELWAGSIQVAQRQGVAARLLHIFGDDLRLMLHVENIIGYALVLRWRALGHELQMQAHC